MRWPFKHLLSSDQTKQQQSNALRRVSLSDEPSDAECRLPSPGATLPRVTQPGSLGPRGGDTTSAAINHHSSFPDLTNLSSGFDNKVATRKQIRRRSLPAVYPAEDSTKCSVLSSSILMANPPTFDNPLRRRGCLDHKHTQQLSEYRQEAIQRELRAKQAAGNLA